MRKSKHVRKCIMLLVWLGVGHHLAVRADDNLDNVLGAFKEIGHGLSAMKDGFAAMGGVVPSSQIYNFAVFNGATKPVDVNVVKYKNVMGARIKSGTSATQQLQPGTHSGNTFYETHLYFSLTIPQANFEEGHHEMGIGSDPMVSLYHVYEDTTGTHAELVTSSTNPPGSNDFSAMIYNGSSDLFPLLYTFTPNIKYQDVATSQPTTNNFIDNQALITATKGQEYTVKMMLEPGVFHTLKSRDGLYFRPSELAGPVNKLSVPITGFAIDGGPALDSKGNLTGENLIYPMRYNYEVLPNSKLVETGLAPGNFKQPLDEKIRDITPLEITFWNPSANDLTSTDASTPLEPLVNQANQSMWVLYTGQVYNRATKKVVDGLLSKVPNGKALSWYALRPTCQKKKDMLYAFCVQSLDDESIKKLLNKYVTLSIPTYQLSDYRKPADIFELLASPLSESAGLFKLDDLNAQAYVVFQKSISNFSFDNGPYYCTLQPPLYDKSSLVSLLLPFLDSTKSTDDITTALQAKIPEWIAMFAVDQKSTRAKVEEFLITYGTTEILDTKNGKTTLNTNGNLALFMFLYGPSSLSRMPLLYMMSGVSSELPTNWVKQEDVILL